MKLLILILLLNGNEGSIGTKICNLTINGSDTDVYVSTHIYTTYEKAIT